MTATDATCRLILLDKEGSGISLQLQYSPFVKTLRKSHISILANLDNGAWTRIRTDLLDTLDRDIALGYTMQQMLNDFGSGQDTLRNLLPKLVETRILIPCTSEVSAGSEIKLGQGRGSVSLVATLRCNLQCRHCSAMAGPTVVDARSSYVDLCCIIKKIADLNPEHLTITGGEPLVRKDILDLLRKTRSIFSGKIALQTNATLVDTHMAQVLATESLVDYFDVSLDGVDETSCAPIRGPSVFARAIQGIKNLQAAGIEKIRTSCVVTTANMHLQYEFARLNQELGTEYLLRSFSPAGRGKANRDEFEPNWEESLRSAEPLLRNKYGKLEDANVKRWLHIKTLRGLTTRAQCSAGRSTIAILPNGDIYPCPVLAFSQFLMGNAMKDGSITEILGRPKNMDLVRSFHIDLRSKCRDCDIRYFCTGGCMGENFERFGDHLAPCQECDRTRSDFARLIWAEK